MKKFLVHNLQQNIKRKQISFKSEYSFFSKLLKMVKREKVVFSQEEKDEQDRRRKVDAIHEKEDDMDFSESSPLSPFIDLVKKRNIKKSGVVEEQDREWQMEALEKTGVAPLTLVIELEDVLYHTFYPDENEGYMSQPLAKYDKYLEFKDEEGELQLISIYWRPFMWEFLDFLKQNQSWLEVIVFTSGNKQYTDLMLEQIDPQGELFRKELRVYQEECDRLEIEDENIDLLVKDLQRVRRPLSRTVYLDHHPFSYWLYPDNCLPIIDWIPETSRLTEDNALETTMDTLLALKHSPDVQSYIYQEYRLRDTLHQFNIL